MENTNEIHSFHDLPTSAEEQKIFDEHWPQVRFVIYEPVTGPSYRLILIALLSKFVLCTDIARNESDAMMLENHADRGWNGEEGGIGLHLRGCYIHSCKMYLFDGSKESASWYNKFQPWQGVVFRDHHDQGSNTKKVFLIADEFEQFLRKYRLHYERQNYKKNSG